MSDDQKQAFDASAYWNKRYEAIDASKSGHVDLPVEYNRWLYRRKQDHLAKALSKVGATLRGKRLLEIAAGSGAWMDFWKAQGVADYMGIDLSERAIEGLKQRYPEERFLQYDLNESGLERVLGTDYDCVSAIDVLYHVVDDQRFQVLMGELASLLKPGGLLVIHDQFLHAATRDYVYIRWRRLKDYEEVLTAAGFEIMYRRPTFFFMIQNEDFGGVTAKLMDALWDRIVYPVIGRLPRAAGAVGYAVDSLVCSILREGPSMEMMICRKRG
jgi:2-polyprenyl-3-methyl-5-hydroxy-6-metoxy-1,4-benzoquinol methylase